MTAPGELVDESARREWLEALYHRSGSAIRAYLSGAVRWCDRDVVDDLAQEVYLTAWRSSDMFPAESDAQDRYLMGIARHRATDYYRRGHRPREVPVAPESAVWASGDVDAEDDSPVWADAQASLGSALDQLDRETAEVLRLRFIEDMGFVAVAERIGRSRATTVRRQAEGLAELRAHLVDGDTEAASTRRVHRPRSAATEMATTAPGSTAPVAGFGGSVEQYGRARLDAAFSGLAPGTRESYRAGWHRRIAPTLGDRLLSELSAADVAMATSAWREAGAGRSSIRNTRAALRQLLEDAVRERVLAANPIDRAARATEVEGVAGGIPVQRTAPGRVVDEPVSRCGSPSVTSAAAVRQAHQAVTTVRAGRCVGRGDRARVEELTRWHTDDRPRDVEADQGEAVAEGRWSA